MVLLAATVDVIDKSSIYLSAVPEPLVSLIRIKTFVKDSAPKFSVY
jgi:hypothetical protein